MVRLIYDGDPGIDDALAIIFAAKCDVLDLEAVTTVGGNVSLEKATKNALRVLSLVGRLDIPVAAGMPHPLVRELVTAEHVHGEDGLDETFLPLPPVQDKCMGAIDLIVGKLLRRPGEVTLVACGPLTNLAEVYGRMPDMGEKVGEVIVMGGAVSVPGNVTPYAEFNVHADPEAAKIVFESDLPLTMVPLDVTLKTLITSEDIEEIRGADTPVTDFIYRALKYSLNFPGHRRLGGCPIHDVLAVGVAVDRGFVKTKKLYVNVVTDNLFTLGKTVVSESNTGEFEECKTKIDVCLDVDARKFIRFFIETVTSK
ncbi:MAG: nucleoside hydrolase [Candidatus Jordarchaeaceae archaeon]